jgi:hypothetical protein
MTSFNQSIAGVVAGDDIDVPCTIKGVPAGQTLVEAWLTLKAKVSDADPGLLQKVITPVAGCGRWSDHRRRRERDRQLLFQLADTETLALPAIRQRSTTSRS